MTENKTHIFKISYPIFKNHPHIHPSWGGEAWILWLTNNSLKNTQLFSGGRFFISLRHTSIYKWHFTATPLSQNNFGPWKSNLHLFFSRKIQILSLILWQFDRNGIIYLKNFREILTLCWWLLRLQKVIQLLWTMLDVWMSFPEKSLAKCQFIWQNIHDGRHIFRHFSADFLHYFSHFGQGSFSKIV